MANMDMEKIRSDYKKGFRKLLVKIANGFSGEDCEKIGFIHLEGINREKYEKSPLKLLEQLQRRGEFSYDKPQNLMEIMEGLPDLTEKKNLVQRFIDENRSIISTFAVQQRALPPVPISSNSLGHYRENPGELQTEAEERLIPAPEQNTDDSAYTTFFKPPSHSLPLDIAGTTFTERRLRSLSFKSESSRSQGSSNEDESDPIYSEPYTAVLISTPQEQFPYLQQRMKLLVKPMRSMIAGTSEGRKVVTSAIMSCERLKSTFFLEILFGDGSREPYLSANLYQNHGGHEEKVSSPYLLAELEVGQRSRRQKKRLENLYSHSVLMEPPSGSGGDLHLPIQENGPTNGSCEDEATPMGADLAASFPSIISHRNFMNKTLVTRPYLTLVLTLRKYNDQL